MLVGIYAFFKEKSVSFKEIKAIFIIVTLYEIATLVFILIAFLKHGLSHEIDLNFYWGVTTFGWYYAIGQILSFIANFFVIIGTRRLLGKEHIYFWIMILIAWSLSGIRLFYNYILH